MEHAWLIAGLGNPGRNYRGTRHNAGFMVVESLADRWSVRLSESGKFRANLVQATRHEQRVLLCQPLTFMNLSGEAIGPLAAYYKVAPDRVLVIVDDANLELGCLRLRPQGRSGGHHGLDSVEQHLGTTAFPRLRIGIGRGERQLREISGYVTAPFSQGEQRLVGAVLDRACEQVECWLDDGVAQAMNRFNGLIELEP